MFATAYILFFGIALVMIGTKYRDLLPIQWRIIILGIHTTALIVLVAQIIANEPTDLLVNALLLALAGFFIGVNSELNE